MPLEIRKIRKNNKKKSFCDGYEKAVFDSMNMIQKIIEEDNHKNQIKNFGG